MRVLLQYCFDHDSARKIYEYVGRSMRRDGVEVDVVRLLDGLDVSAYDVLISRDFVAESIRRLPRLGCYGGRQLTRPQGLVLTGELGMPVVPWALAEDRDQVLRLFDRWQAERLLVKRSGTCKGKGVSAFDRHSVDRVDWNAAEDIFCPDLSGRDGNVYKAEVFNGRIAISWISLRKPVRAGFNGFKADIPSSTNRRLFRFPRATREKLERLSKGLTRRGFGYTSLDTMRTPDGEYTAIEINAGQAATWWTARYFRTRWRYARAACALIEEIARTPRGKVMPARSA